ncbi:DNA-binding protein [Geomonas sp. Red69]|uniref:DNA-binding protein n=1 Tax=Geomonas diazotrophica TaxID=2843197 RepID=A0ABX8JK70_9BACT|nr:MULTISPECIES: DNA-binding protein [Geomonas]MBU5635740.1 DNA-binding protein [Geomonas diazotrophica]QWV98024.1 DNA-binding protein [Geomonas nitrogeniifigens]QXE87155.1 DNA-binding protein [Geomonas nitrogeniifigens]
MMRYSTIMSVLVTLALPVAGTCADAPKAPEKADAKVEAVAAPKAPEKAESKVDAITKSMSKSDHSMMMGGSAPAGAGAAEINPNPTGKVVETMVGGGYTYANLEVAGGTKTWVAYPVLETRVGDTLSFQGCMPMTNFQSKTLKRTFDTILFCNAPKIKGGAAKPAAKEAKKAAPGEKIKVEKATGANAYTVEEIFAKCGSLNGKQIEVRGQVVKVASGIMSKNWLHLQDGTGNDKKKTNDLVVTTTDNAEEGDVITVSGILAKDKDFGGGYKYTAIIEKGSVKK